jgi:hypothetical protein
MINTTNPLQEDNGLIEIHRICVQMHAIWRPTICHDLGVDGQIEFLEPGTNLSTGYILAVQSKSGPSYFQNQDNTFVKFYLDDKHRQYWRRIQLPVILVLHNPVQSLTIFTNVKPQLSGDGPLLIEKSKIFNNSCREFLIGIIKEYANELSPKEILDKLRRIELNRDGNKILTGIDFLLACTNRSGRYFELRMRRVCALFELLSLGTGYYINSEDYEFILRNVITIHSCKIAEDFMNEFESVWYDLNSVPDISSPLTAIGNDVIDYVYSHPEKYILLDSYSHLGITNHSELIKLISSYAQQLSDKLDSSDRITIEPR